MNIKIFLLVTVLGLGAAQDCVWNKDSDFPSNYPLIINLDTWLGYHAVYEGSERVVRIAEDTTVVVACAGSTLDIGGEVAEGVCSGGELQIGGSGYSIGDLGCSSSPDDDAIYTGATCGDGNTGLEASIGFPVPGYQFFETVNVCFNDDLKYPIYARHIVFGASVEAADSNPSRPDFRMGSGFYDFDPDDCYSTTNQDSYYNDILGDPNYIDTGSNEFFSRGHLAPNADFFEEMEADATFYYINAVPQWQNYNGINWAQFEESVREMAASYDTNIDVWTGPHNLLVVDDANSNPVPMYHCASQGSNTVPVPEMVWKVVYEPSTDSALAIIGSNVVVVYTVVVYEPSTDSALAIIGSNVPHQTSVPDTICPDIGCTNVEWMDGITSPEQLDRGYLYCCSAQDFKDAIPDAPDLGSAGLLLSYGKRFYR